MLKDWTPRAPTVFYRFFEVSYGQSSVTLVNGRDGWSWTTTLFHDDTPPTHHGGSSKGFLEAEQQIEAFLDEHGFKWLPPNDGNIPVIFDVDR